MDAMPDLQQQQQLQKTNDSKNVVPPTAYVKILEQPAGKALRFRYECEGRSAGSIPGASSTAENKTYPTIEIVGYKGRAVVVVSCVTKDPPYRPHPHNLVGKEGCKKGVCTLEINPETMRAIFSNLGIQCVKKKDIEAALKAREEIRVDPFKTGFEHRFNPSGIDLNSVRLCFQVFTESDKGKFTHPLPPVVSEPIYDKKVKCDLVIYRLCSCTTTVLGNTQIILLCEKVAKEDISVRLFEEINGQIIWEAFGEFQHTDVHKQAAITFKTPPYHKMDITEPAKVFIQLRRPSDGVTSEPLPFEYIPLDSDPGHLKRKRQRMDGDPVYLLMAQQHQQQSQNGHNDVRKSKPSWWGAANLTAIKTEPKEAASQAFGGMYQAPADMATSPHPLSPTGAYCLNMPSPYQVAAQIMPSNHQFNAGGGNQEPSPMDTSHYHTFSPEPPQHYQNSSFANTAGHWEAKCQMAAGNNLNNPKAGNSLLPPANVSQAMATGHPINTACWNLTSSHFHPHHQQLQQQYASAQPSQSEGGHNTNNNNNNNNINVSAANSTGPATTTNSVGLSNLLTIDSEQYIRFDADAQQMLRLNSEDLRISDLAITT